MFTTQRLEAVQNSFSHACDRAGRNPAEVTIIGVTKTVQAEDAAAAYNGGLSVFGENRVQEGATKVIALQQMGLKPTWHLIGHLQTNKAKKAIELFDVIQSVDSRRLAEALQRHAHDANRVVDVFAQINTSLETTKFGAPPDEAISLVREIASFPNLHLDGLMTIGAFVEDEEVIRRCFRTLRELAAEISSLNLPEINMSHLSMGMSNDFEIAIEEGATMVRIGRALFGERVK